MENIYFFWWLKYTIDSPEGEHISDVIEEAWFRDVLNYMPDTEKIKKSTVKALEEFQKKPYLQNKEILKNLEHAGGYER